MTPKPAPNPTATSTVSVSVSPQHPQSRAPAITTTKQPDNFCMEYCIYDVDYYWWDFWSGGFYLGLKEKWEVLWVAAFGC